MDVSKSTAEAYLTSLLGKTLRVTTSDTRLFVGEFKCTDAERNVILSRTFEYRHPSATALSSIVASTPSKSSARDTAVESPNDGTVDADQSTIAADMASRYLGLVVVPGKYITKIEVEDFLSQLKDIPEGERWVLREGVEAQG